MLMLKWIVLLCFQLQLGKDDDLFIDLYFRLTGRNSILRF